MVYFEMQAHAELKELKREMKQREDLINVLTADRDNAIATLKQHGLKIDHNVKVAIFSVFYSVFYSFIQLNVILQ